MPYVRHVQKSRSVEVTEHNFLSECRETNSMWLPVLNHMPTAIAKTQPKDTENTVPMRMKSLAICSA